MTATQKLAVSEIFGPTVQGEGPSTGQLAYFVRLAGCNLTCSWCDAKYTWDFRNATNAQDSPYKRADEVTMMTPNEVIHRLHKLGWYEETLLVVTGGEPMLQQDAVFSMTATRTRRIEIETNGTVMPRLDYVRYNVSPKLASSEQYGYAEARRINIPVLQRYNNLDSIFKFVVTHPRDLDKVSQLCDLVGISNRKIWIMPEGITPFEIQNRQSILVDEVTERGWNLSTRLHILLWGNRRGR